MGNSKALSVSRKHRQKQRAAKEKLHLHLDGKLEIKNLPALARSYLTRYLRVHKKSTA